jgi:hypothetical protein
MPLESEVYIEEPYGSLILHSDYTKPAVFILLEVLASLLL